LDASPVRRIAFQIWLFQNWKMHVTSWQSRDENRGVGVAIAIATTGAKI
jgi:hypothetical protein